MGRSGFGEDDQLDDSPSSKGKGKDKAKKKKKKKRKKGTTSDSDSGRDSKKKDDDDGSDDGKGSPRGRSRKKGSKGTKSAKAAKSAKSAKDGKKASKAQRTGHRHRQTSADKIGRLELIPMKPHFMLKTVRLAHKKFGKEAASTLNKLFNKAKGKGLRASVLNRKVVSRPRKVVIAKCKLADKVVGKFKAVRKGEGIFVVRSVDRALAKSPQRVPTPYPISVRYPVFLCRPRGARRESTNTAARSRASISSRGTSGRETSCC